MKNLEMNTRGSNPWRLSPRQIEVMDTVCTVGCYKSTARRLDIEPKTVEMIMNAITNKMGMDNRVQRLIAWDRWRQSQKTENQLEQA